MDQNLSLYKVFHTVAKHGNISRAAKELYISQPALSKSIAKLESNLGVTLFFRSSRGVTLTQEGRLLYEYTTTAFSTLERAEEQLGTRDVPTTEQLRIGVSTTLCKYLLLPILQKFMWKYPQIRIIIHCHSTFRTIQDLEKGELDLGLIGRPDYLGPITFQPVLTIQDMLVATNSYLNSLPDYKTSGDILALSNVMLLDKQNISRLYVERYLSAGELELNQVTEISSMDLLIEFAKLGLGVACVIGNFVTKELDTGELVRIPLPVSIPPRQLGLAFPKDKEPSKAVETFLTFYQSNL